ncbi:polyphosphate polymerase domain-containing protein [Culicoidibacter larvae]|uniref:Polyphosphate polymerase domain-containing protein n=1 Tax=Culicoidibacter larvae TaxID=2579976 RepID=A0A5R8QET0_9FIRM|nr:polyphosphate polymerase domain-containing protein [Culicoidibacter larvae]TLG74297.1 polyphosphate polymerase domain-containing protein [Culicoidibacter larvae]
MAKTKLNHIFERREKKYRLTKEQFQRVYVALLEHMHADKYGKHTICSLYYDTDDYYLIRTSNEKPVYKEKFRLRSYGTPNDDSTVFLELKKKYDGVVYKRRESLTMYSVQKYLNDGHLKVLDKEPNQIMMEIDWFMNRYQLAPKVMVAYDRIALYGKEESAFRVTFDFDIRWRDYDLDLRYGDYGNPLIATDECMMEVKALGAIPVWLTEILSRERLYSTSFSKYGIIYKQFIAPKNIPVTKSMLHSLVHANTTYNLGEATQKLRGAQKQKGVTYHVG